MSDINFNEFRNTVYYTKNKIVIPILNITYDKKDYLVKGKIDIDKLNSDLNKLYDEYII